MGDKILIVDDDIAVLKMLSKVIKSYGLEPHTVSGGKEALKCLESDNYALMLLDINMPDMDGFEVLEYARNSNNPLPIIVISGRIDEYDALYGLDLGADDYITKPFNPVVLGAKVKALIRRSNISLVPPSPIIKAGPFSYDTSTLRFFKNDKELILSGKENQLIKFFLDNQNQVFTRTEIYENLWGNHIVDENAVTVYINRLRNKIEDDPSEPVYLKNIRGIGYLFTVL